MVKFSIINLYGLFNLAILFFHHLILKLNFKQNLMYFKLFVNLILKFQLQMSLMKSFVLNLKLFNLIFKVRFHKFIIFI